MDLIGYQENESIEQLSLHQLNKIMEELPNNSGLLQDLV